MPELFAFKVLNVIHRVSSSVVRTVLMSTTPNILATKPKNKEFRFCETMGVDNNEENL